MARSNYSAGKRQRDREKAEKKKAKEERKRIREDASSDVPVTTVEEVQGGLRSIEQVMASLGSPNQDTKAAPVKARLFVGGLSWRLTVDELRKKFEEYGQVADAVIVNDRDTGESRGFGFVTMNDRKDAASVIQKLNGEELDGRTLVVKPATERGR